MLKVSFLSLALAASFVALPAQAQPNVHGRVGEVIVGGTSSVYVGGVHNSRDNNGNVPALNKDAFSANIVPSAAVFIAPNFALGLHGDFGITHARGNNDWSLAVGPQFIGHVPMAATSSLLPKLAVDYRRARGENQVDLAFNVDVAMHVNRQVSLTVGPQITQQVYGSTNKGNRTTTYGLQFGVLGWL